MLRTPMTTTTTRTKNTTTPYATHNPSTMSLFMDENTHQHVVVVDKMDPSTTITKTPLPIKTKMMGEEPSSHHHRRVALGDISNRKSRTSTTTVQKQQQNQQKDVPTTASKNKTVLFSNHNTTNNNTTLPVATHQQQQRSIGQQQHHSTTKRVNFSSNDTWLFENMGAVVAAGVVAAEDEPTTKQSRTTSIPLNQIRTNDSSRNSSSLDKKLMKENVDLLDDPVEDIEHAAGRLWSAEEHFGDDDDDDDDLSSLEDDARHFMHDMRSFIQQSRFQYHQSRRQEQQQAAVSLQFMEEHPSLSQLFQDDLAALQAEPATPTEWEESSSDSIHVLPMMMNDLDFHNDDLAYFACDISL